MRLPLTASVARLATFATARPQQFLGIMLALHLLLWWGVQMLVQANLSLDGLEMLSWGHEGLLASPKHPTLPGWVAEGMALATGNSVWGQFLLGPVFVTATFWLVWRLGLRITTPARALLGVLALEGVIYFTFTSPEFNNNVVLYPLWAALALAAHRAVSMNRWRDWLLTGLAAGLSMNGKYVSALLILSLLGFLLTDAKGRRQLRTPRPWVAALLTLALLVPHAWGLWQIDFRPILFPLGRAQPASGLADHVLFPLRFFGAQLVAILGAVVVALVARSGSSDSNIAVPATPLAGRDRRFLLWIALGPCLLAMLAAGLAGRDMRSMWGSPMWNFVGLLLLCLPARALTQAGMRRAVTASIAVAVLALLAFGGKTAFGPLVRHQASRANFPGQALADAVSQGWSARVPGRPLTLVAGDPWLGGNVGFYASGRPSVILDADLSINPWLTQAQLRRDGAVIVWRMPPELPADAVPGWLESRFAGAEIQPVLTLAPQSLFDLPDERVGWAIQPPDAGNL
jgi:4-amino-4-deoxy-L-arabinose transferase-like glycosyltransferase